MKVKQERKQKSTLIVNKDKKNSESSLNKAVKNVKKILKKKNTTTKTPDTTTETSKVVEEKKPFQMIKKSKNIIKIKGIKPKKINKSKAGKQLEVKKLENGLVYIGHIPHGFYEEQMKEYFSQFGKVTRVRVARSSRTGQSRGYGYVEFALPEVAFVAAESMNNYLMAGRLVKTTYITPEEQHKKYFKGPEWSLTNYPKLTNRTKTINKHNAPISAEKHEKNVEKSLKKFTSLSKKLKEEGINIKFKISEL